MSVQDCDLTGDRPLTADQRVKINNERLAQSACVFFLSRQLSVICGQQSRNLSRLYHSEHPARGAWISAAIVIHCLVAKT